MDISEEDTDFEQAPTGSADKQRTKKPAEKLSITLVHGDILMLAGDDFEVCFSSFLLNLGDWTSLRVLFDHKCSVKRTGTSICTSACSCVLVWVLLSVFLVVLIAS
jgi:hypothetical protein